MCHHWGCVFGYIQPKKKIAEKYLIGIFWLFFQQNIDVSIFKLSEIVKPPKLFGIFREYWIVKGIAVPLNTGYSMGLRSP